MMNQKFKKAADVSCWVCFLGILLSVYHHLFFFGHIPQPFADFVF